MAIDERMPMSPVLEQALIAYTTMVSLVEQAHRHLHDTIGSELNKVGHIDITAVQALLIYNIGDKELSAKELRTRAGYPGSNVSYNLKKLVSGGFLDQQRSHLDRRVLRIRLTDKGHEIRQIVEALHRKYSQVMEQRGLGADKLIVMNDLLEKVNRFLAGRVT